MATVASIAAGLQPNEWQKLNTNLISNVFTPSAKRSMIKGGTYAYPREIIEAWGGGAWDSIREEFIFLGGGHSAYLGNELYRFSLTDLAWHRCCLPSQVVDTGTHIIPVHVPASTPESVPSASVHTYCKLTFVSAIDRYLMWPGTDFYQSPAARYEGENLEGPGVVNAGPWLLNPNNWDADKTAGDTGTGVDPTDLGANVYYNADWVVRGFAPRFSSHTCTDGDTVWAMGVQSPAGIAACKVSVDGTTDSYTILADGTSGVGTPRAMVYCSAINALVLFDDTAGLLWLYDLTSKPIRWQRIILDTTVSGWWAGKEPGVTYDADRNVIVVWGGNAEIWEIACPTTLAPATFKIRKLTQASGPSALYGTNGIQSRFAYTGSGLCVGVGSDGTNGDVWALKCPADTGHAAIKGKNQITGATQVDNTLSPLIALPIADASGSTVHDYATGQDRNIVGTLEAYGGQATLSGGLVIAEDLGTLAGATIVVGFYQAPNDSGSIWDQADYLRQGADLVMAVNISGGTIKGTVSHQSTWLNSSDAALPFLSMAWTLGDGIASKCSINGAPVRSGTTLADVPLGQGLELGPGISNLAYVYIYPARVSDAQLIQMAQDPHNFALTNTGPADVIKPEITLLGDAVMTLKVGEAYAEPGYTALDDTDGDITANVVVTGSVDNMTPGAHTLYYNVTDAAGNVGGEKARTINVIANTMSLTGTDIPDGSHQIILDDTGGTRIYDGTVTFASGAADFDIALPVGHRVFGYIRGATPPTDGCGITGVVA